MHAFPTLPGHRAAAAVRASTSSVASTDSWPTAASDRTPHPNQGPNPNVVQIVKKKKVPAPATEADEALRRLRDRLDREKREYIDAARAALKAEVKALERKVEASELKAEVAKLRLKQLKVAATAVAAGDDTDDTDAESDAGTTMVDDLGAIVDPKYSPRIEATLAALDGAEQSLATAKAEQRAADAAARSAKRALDMVRAEYAAAAAKRKQQQHEAEIAAAVEAATAAATAAATEAAEAAAAAKRRAEPPVTVTPRAAPSPWSHSGSSTGPTTTTSGYSSDDYLLSESRFTAGDRSRSTSGGLTSDDDGLSKQRYSAPAFASNSSSSSGGSNAKQSAAYVPNLGRHRYVAAMARERGVQVPWYRDPELGILYQAGLLSSLHGNYKSLKTAFDCASRSIRTYGYANGKPARGLVLKHSWFATIEAFDEYILSHIRGGVPQTLDDGGTLFD
ncbi:hypothetical protein H9P43_006566 [Blastocladiella emersonii ATCC 22665]|nr:hypothetical protein H9P43_006566 [Blastocladiella emersonii ATCC 22665]